MTPDTTDGGSVSQAKNTDEQTPNDGSAKLNPTLLHDAINSAPLDVLRRLLIEIIDKNDEARAQASAHILKPANGGSAKRKAYETCINCDKGYDIGDNAEETCVYHDGEPDVDYSDDFWVDHPEGFGEPEDLVDEPDYAGGFAWTCCKQKYQTASCIKDKHRSERASARKTGRIDVASLMN